MSGKLLNPGNIFFLKLASNSVRDVNRQRDSDGVSYARKALIITVIALNTNGLWDETKLIPELKRIVSKHSDYFNGTVGANN